MSYGIGTAIVSGLTPLFTAWTVRGHGLGAPVCQELAAGAVALALWVRRMPLHLGAADARPEAMPQVVLARPAP